MCWVTQIPIVGKPWFTTWAQLSNATLIYSRKHILGHGKSKQHSKRGLFLGASVKNSAETTPFLKNPRKTHVEAKIQNLSGQHLLAYAVKYNPIPKYVETPLICSFL